jgi:hypothetical protein
MLALMERQCQNRLASRTPCRLGSMPTSLVCGLGIRVLVLMVVRWEMVLRLGRGSWELKWVCRSGRLVLRCR